MMVSEQEAQFKHTLVCHAQQAIACGFESLRQALYNYEVHIIQNLNTIYQNSLVQTTDQVVLQEEANQIIKTMDFFATHAQNLGYTKQTMQIAHKTIAPDGLFGRLSLRPIEKIIPKTKPDPNESTIIVKFLPEVANVENVTHLFAQYGKVKKVCLPIDRFRNRSRFFGYVDFETPQDANNAVQELNGYKWEDKQLYVAILIRRNR